MDIDFKDYRILYSFGLSRGGDHYLEDSETLYDVCTGEMLEWTPASEKYIVLTGEKILFGNYNMLDVSFYELSGTFKQFFEQSLDIEAAKKS